MVRRSSSSDWSYEPDPGDLDAFDLGQGDRGVLLIHGFCGTPPEMRGLGEYLAGRGFRVRGALLRGHGTTPEDLAGTTGKDWVDSAQADLDALKRTCAEVFVAGQSMGGTLSLLLAARNPDVKAVATTSALVDLGRFTELQILLGSRILRWHYPDRASVDLFDKEAVKQLRSYARRPMRRHVDLVQLGRQALAEAGAIRVPALLMHGLRDQVVPPANAARIAAAIGPNATVRLFERSGHAMTVDVDRREIYELVAAHFSAAGSADAGRLADHARSGGRRVNSL